MILDSKNQYSAAQALTVSAASTNAIDHGAARNLGVGEELVVVITVGVAPKKSDGDETYAAKTQTDSDSAFGTVADGFSVTIPRTAAQGAKYVIPLPNDGSIKRYTRTYYTLGGTNPAITLSAELLPAKFVQNDFYFPKGYVIL